MDHLLSEPEKRRVLHVDDDPAFLDLTAEFLAREAEDLTVVSEVDPRAALDRLAEERLDCIVSDYQMPEVDGLEFLERVRERESATPFVLFTGQGSESVAAQAIEVGVDSYLRKKSGSAQYAVLANRIHSLIDQFWARRRAEQLEQTYELLARTTTDAFWIRDMGTSETLYSEGIRQFGYEPGLREDGFEWWVERVHPADRDRSRDLNDLQREGAPAGFDDIESEFGEFTHEYRWRTADGDYVPCQSRGIVRFEDDEPVEMIGAMTRLDETP